MESFLTTKFVLTQSPCVGASALLKQLRGYFSHADAVGGGGVSVNIGGAKPLPFSPFVDGFVCAVGA